ncbi:phospholipid scramblase 2-like [Sminthopsis crassicaudata]|uniref:phospholipid scramblase 2-like n=1 Tax=Sminthopsis crassicaudata TaxID=9301 RepID=UPI003D69394C
MPAPVPLANCPPGLEYLQQIKTIRVHQQIELLEILTGFETNNRYEVKNDSGQMIYFVTEDTDDITRNRYKSSRPFTLKVTDSMDHEVMNIHRPYKFSCCWCCCCCCCDSMAQELEVESPPGSVIGYVRQNGSFCQGKFRIENERKDHLMNITSSCFCCCSNTIFKVKSLHQETVGTIIREWPGALTNITADSYEIHFELDDVKMKALILSACFLIVSTAGSAELSAEKKHGVRPFLGGQAEGGVGGQAEGGVGGWGRVSACAALEGGLLWLPDWTAPASRFSIPGEKQVIFEQYFVWSSGITPGSELLPSREFGGNGEWSYALAFSSGAAGHQAGERKALGVWAVTNFPVAGLLRGNLSVPDPAEPLR